MVDYGGNWSGEYIVTACDGAADFRSCSRAMFDEGNAGARIRYPFRLTLVQDDDRVTGQMVILRPVPPDTVIPVSGFVRPTGALVLEATVPQEGLDPQRLTNWSSTLTASSTQMAGSFTRILPYRSFSVVATLRTEHEFAGMTRAQ